MNEFFDEWGLETRRPQGRPSGPSHIPKCLPFDKGFANHHDAMIDWMLVNPTATRAVMATVFSYSVGGLSLIINSDAFQAKLKTRQTEIIDPILICSITERFQAVAQVGLDTILYQIENKRMDDKDLIAATALATKALGFGQAETPQNLYVIQAPTIAPTAEAWADQFKTIENE